MNHVTVNARPENLVDLLDKLVLPAEPAPISLFPETIGWFFIALILIVGTCGLTWHQIRRNKANAYRRHAIAALPHAAHDPEMIARIIRQTALVAFPREEVAGLYGDAWLAFLDSTCAGQPFRNGPGRQIARGPYDPSVKVSAELISAARHWIMHHQRGPVP